MSESFSVALERAQQRTGDTVWPLLSPAERSAALYHELCRIDSNCKRTGTAADAALPPCPASESFIGRRACRLAGR
ncbi:MAG: hypothetical protein IT555_09270 [Acetobacteraceae bacterium]|nr:hypothetical protein [Acetobacteraceae bacterium]